MPAVEIAASWWIALLAAGGVVVGLTALARGLLDYRSGLRVADTSTSPISSMAAGEVRISGVIEPAELTLVSLLTSTPCVYYRSSVGQAGEGSPIGLEGLDVAEERSVGFRVRDATGSVRVFPRGARIDAPIRLDEETGAMGDEPPALALRVGPATQAVETDRATAAAALLQVRDLAAAERPGWLGVSDRRRHYREARLEPGDHVTVVGRALPFADLSDPAAADIGTQANLAPDDPEVAADLAAARARGTLASSPAAAWGNAAIAGFGVGRPVRTPDLDPAAAPLPLAGDTERARIERTFEIAPETLVLASSAEVPLLIAHGAPGEVVERSRLTLAIGLLGAVLAIGSAMALALAVGGELNP